MRGKSGKKLGAWVGQEAWGPLPLQFHTELGLVPVGEWEMFEAQALPHCKVPGGRGRERLETQDPLGKEAEKGREVLAAFLGSAWV